MPSISITTSPYHDASNSFLRKVGGIYTGPASYVTGGDPCTPAAFAMGKIHLLIFEPFVNATPIIIIGRYSVSQQVVQFFDMAGAQIANATDLSGYTARFEAIGN